MTSQYMKALDRAIDENSVLQDEAKAAGHHYTAHHYQSVKAGLTIARQIAMRPAHATRLDIFLTERRARRARARARKSQIPPARTPEIGQFELL